MPMKNIRKISADALLKLFIMVFMFSLSVSADGAWGLSKNDMIRYSVNNGLPANEVHSVYRDRDGFLWVATRYGIGFYDGYSFRTFKSDLRSPDLLTSNNIQCMVEDTHQQIWFGTQNGINVLDKKTWTFWHKDLEGIYNKKVSCLLVSRDGSVWIGTESGLCRYDYDKKSFKLYSGEVTGNVLSGTAIKSLMEDSKGNIWIGTWSAGLYRYSPSQKRFFSYPKMNWRNSAHVLYEDVKGNIWVGAWDGGLYLLQHPYDMKRCTWKVFVHEPDNPQSLGDNMVYSIGTDENTGNIWIGTRSGLSVLDKDDFSVFYNYHVNHKSDFYFPCREVNSIVSDASGNMWLGTANSGLVMVKRNNHFFENFTIDYSNDNILTPSANAIYVDDRNQLWWGLTSQGFMRMDLDTRTFQHFSSMPEFKNIKTMSSVNCFMKRKITGELWIGLFGDGICVYEEGHEAKILNSWNCSFIKDNSVYSLFEDHDGNVWIGTKAGLSILQTNGNGYIFNSLHVDGHDYSISTINCISQDSEGNIWIATDEDGIVKMSGDFMHPKKIKSKAYGHWNNAMPTSGILCIFVDSQQRIWVGTQNCGLFTYDRAHDCFKPVKIYNSLLSDRVTGIEEDDMGNLWLSTGSGLACFNPDNTEESDVKIYSEADGLINMEYNRNSSFYIDGKMFFGGFNGISRFTPSSIVTSRSKVSVFFTDFSFGNVSIYDMNYEDIKSHCASLPVCAEKITVPDDCKMLTISFSSLMYSSTRQARYAYKLEGFDNDWQYTLGERNFASYSNLPYGTYKFRLKAANENGVWNDGEKVLTVVVAAPWYATSWTYAAYFVIFACIVLWLVLNARRQYKLKRTLYYQNVEKDSLDKLNHAKMQFFTNITHELLTPLTIISASIEELRTQYSSGAELYDVMTYNVNRLLRLLQQILDFRKAETGNLRLRVCRGDIISFVRTCTEEFIPLMKRSGIDFQFTTSVNSLYGYYDSDKLEKILYNLLSNAAKYNDKDTGFVNLTIETEDRNTVVIKVEDNGKGISKKVRKRIFDRFYEDSGYGGTSKGNGIGLSLTLDLVKLCKGEIEVESEVGKGSVFIVKLPISKDAFSEDDMVEDDSYDVKSDVKNLSDESVDGEVWFDSENNKPTILIVEDNEDLQQVMKRLLSRDYNVITANNGKEGLEVVKHNEVNLIISDVLMPEMNGLVLCKYLKDSIDYCHIPIILLTALNKDEDKVDAYESGADAYITKPFDMMVLKSRIKNLFKVAERNARNFRSSFSVDDQAGMVSIDEAFMQKIIDCIKKHLDDPDFDQQQLFEEAGISKSTLYRKLKMLTGLSPSSLIRKYRLETARKMLESNKHLRVSELAYSVGFNDPKYFSSIFKKEYGMLPSEMQQKFQAKDTADSERQQ